MKMAIGLAFTGLSFLVLSMANATVTEGHLAPVWWLLGAYVVLELGEMFLSPIGLAAVTQLSVPATVGVMMGAYWLTTSLSEQAAAMFSSFAALDIPEGGKIDLVVAQQKYGTLFDHMLWLGLGSARRRVVAIAADQAVDARREVSAIRAGKCLRSCVRARAMSDTALR